MALSLQTIGSANEDVTFVQRVKGRLVISAANVFSEGAGVQNHTNRLVWQEAVFAEPDLWARREACAVAGQNINIGGTTLAAITDTEIGTAVDSLINHYAALVT